MECFQLFMNVFGFDVFVYVAFLLATQLNNLAEENILEANCVCVLKKTLTNTLTDGRYVFLFSISLSFLFTA